MSPKAIILVGSLLMLSACQTVPAPIPAPNAPLRIFETLASDDMSGRKTGTEGSRKAREFLMAEAEALNIFDDIRLQSFDFERPVRNEKREVTGTEPMTGVNLIGLMDTPDGNTGPLLVMTAHYDHLGERDGKIYNGADDNASGSAALFAIAQSFEISPPKHDVMIVWLDAEEMGLSGAKALLDSENNFEGRPVFNLNLDMISQNEREIYFAGAYHTPALKSLIAPAASNLTLSFGHDAPEDGSDDWTTQSDHGPFHQRGIPFGYFGVEDHPHYHRDTDEFATIPQAFYRDAVQTVVNAAHILDRNLDTLAKSAQMTDGDS